MAALHLCATPTNRAGQYTTLADATGRWGRSRVAGGLLAPFQVARVAVLDCCAQLLHALLHSLPRPLG